MRAHNAAAIAIALVTLPLAGPAWGFSQTWTDNADWASGTENGVNHTTVADQIQLNPEAQPEIDTPFIWIANSGSNTVAKIDTRTGAQYPGSPYPACANPSRTAVDVNGNCWVGCRNDGRLMKLRYEDGAALVDVRPGAGNIVRAVAIDGEGYVWAGIWDANQMVKVDPTTGAVLKTASVSCPYGAAAEANGHIWVVSRCADAVTLLDASGNVKGTYGMSNGYGLATDQWGNAWVASYGGYNVTQFSVTNGAVMRTIGLSGGGRGVAMDADGFVWVAMSTNNKVAKVQPSGQMLFDVSVGANPVGVAVDDQNQIWVVNQSADSATKIDAATGGIVGTFSTGGSGPYTYSDMTGFQLQTFAVPAEGTWTVKFDAGCRPLWRDISWTASLPGATSVSARARVAETEAGLAAAGWTGPYASGDALALESLPWIEIALTLRSPDAAVNVPTVQDLTVRFNGLPETCDNIDNDCDQLIDEELTRACETACGQGQEVCIAGTWTDCDAPPVFDEVCDFQDNDCDGDVDEGVQNRCGGCGPEPREECDGVDNNCDGVVDEGCDCVEGSTRSCGTDVGECTAGTQSCLPSGQWDTECVGETPPADEICDGVDNDCDGDVDEGCDCITGDTRACGSDVGACRAGLETCDAEGRWGECLGAVGPGEEVCDCFDNNCNGEVDEGELCGDPGSDCLNCACTEPCQFNECPFGQACIDGYCVPRDCSEVSCEDDEVCEWGLCVPTCDGVECPAGQRCAQGVCVADDCTTDGCPLGQRCVNRLCVDDPCYGLGCAPGQYCLDGECHDSCGRIICTEQPGCEDGSCVCRDGQCVPDLCAGEACPEGTECVDGHCVDPNACGEGEIPTPDGGCEPDPCERLDCPLGQVCERGQCLPGDTDGDGVPDDVDPDIDGDGIPNDQDCAPPGDCDPTNPDDQDFRWDHDNDYVDDVADPDDDNDGVDDVLDLCGDPPVSCARDHDNDGTDDGTDPDDDGDGVPDAEDRDAFGGDRSYDFDNDGTNDAVDLDDDNDGAYDDEDVCGDPPADCRHDHNNDGVPDPEDPDDDNDGIPDAEDVCGDPPADCSRDHNDDGVHDGEDADDDDDGIPDAEDVCADGSDCSFDHDNDGSHDGEDTDDDNDGVPDAEDVCGYPEQDCSLDTDNDSRPNGVDEDDDNDGIPDVDDPYPLGGTGGTGEEEDEPPETCGCGASPTGAGGGLLLLLLGLVLRRRRG